MTLHQLSALRAVVHSGSYAKAAEALFTSASALLQQVRNLEKELGYQVLVKSKTGMALTEAGLAFWRSAQEALVLLEHGMEDGRSVAAAKKSTLRIGLPNKGLANSQYMMSVIFKFHRLHPDICVQFVNCDYYDVAGDLDAGRFDVRLTQYMPIFDERKFSMVRAYCTNYFCIMSPGDPLAEREVLNAENLRGRTVHVHKYDKTDAIDEQMARWAPCADIVVSEVNSDALFRCCLSGDLFILRFKQHVLTSALHAVRLNYRSEDYTVFVAAEKPSPCASVFLEFVRGMRDEAITY